MPSPAMGHSMMLDNELALPAGSIVGACRPWSAGAQDPRAGVAVQAEVEQATQVEGGGPGV
jgi:hypothetical protein